MKSLIELLKLPYYVILLLAGVINMLLCLPKLIQALRSREVSMDNMMEWTFENTPMKYIIRIAYLPLWASTMPGVILLILLLKRIINLYILP